MDICGRTCGVETKCMLSLHIICSGMHLIKRKEGVFRSASGVSVLYASTV